MGTEVLNETNQIVVKTGKNNPKKYQKRKGYNPLKGQRTLKVLRLQNSVFVESTSVQI